MPDYDDKARMGYRTHLRTDVSPRSRPLSADR